MSVFQAIWTDIPALVRDVFADRHCANRCATHRVSRFRNVDGRTIADQRKAAPAIRMVRLHPFKIEMVLWAFDSMRNRIFRTGNTDVSDYFHCRGTEIKNAARIRKASGAV